MSRPEDENAQLPRSDAGARSKSLDYESVVVTSASCLTRMSSLELRSMRGEMLE